MSCLLCRLLASLNNPKQTLNKPLLRNMRGEKSIVTSEGAEWKTLRSMLGPSFSVNHLSTIIPDLTDQVLIFREGLQMLSKTGLVFEMQELACNLAIDVISKMFLGNSFNARRDSLLCIELPPNNFWGCLQYGSRLS
jgi:cytochrome P450